MQSITYANNNKNNKFRNNNNLFKNMKNNKNK